MSLKKWLAKIGDGAEMAGPVFGEMGRKGLEKIGLPGAGRAFGEATVRHPRMAGILGIGGGGAAGALAAGSAARGARALDDLTADPDAEMPPHIAEAFREAGMKPEDFEDAGSHAAYGAVAGGMGLGSLAHLLRGGPGGLKGLAKYMAIAGAGGAGLGAMTHTYKPREHK